MSECGCCRRPGVALMLVGSILGLALLAGCGKGDKDAERVVPSYVPAGIGAADSAAADTAAADTAAGGAPAGGPATAPAETVTTQATLSSPAAKVTPPPPAPRARDAAREPAAGGPFSLQVGSFRSLDNARALVTRIEALGYRPVLESVVLGGETHHRVLLRGLANRAEASRTGEALRAELGITYLIRQSD